MFCCQSVVVRLLLALLVSLLLCGVVSAEPVVIPLSSGERIGAAFEGLESPWVMDRASIAGGRVEAVVCNGVGGECFEADFSKPAQECAGKLLAAWCVEYGEGAPEGMRMAVESQFGAHKMADIWAAPQGTTDAELVTEEAPPDESGSPILAYLLALATLLVPLLVGIGSGWLLVRMRGLVESRLAGVVLLLLPVVVAATVPMTWLRIGFYDLLLIGQVAMLGFLGLAHRVARSWTRREFALLAGGMLVGCLLAEGGSRLLSGVPPAFPPPRGASLVLPESGGYPHSGVNCQGLFPNLHPDLIASRTRFPERLHQILHLGDSMLAGDLVAPNERTVYRLNDLNPDVCHLDAGFSGTGPDHYYLAMRRWLSVHSVNLVVWHLFVFNDAEDSMTHPYACCGNLPPLSFADGEVQIGCLEPVEAGFYANRFVNSPAPYFLRVATHFSHFARYLCATAGREARKRMEAAASPEEGRRRVRMVVRQAKAELDEKGIPMVIVMVPYRGTLEPSYSGVKERESVRLFVQSLCEELQIPCLDGKEAFHEAVLKEGTTPYFISDPVWDYHFTAVGHQLYAEWLHRVLQAL